ncbi:MAG: MgtC/SapB family protein [Clostridiales bacterium]|nr:MgtC/SapB family protein [Clostridiales bacterium]
MQDILAFFHTHEELIYALRIILAGICGGIIGVERTLRQKDAGFRTHIIVAMGSALMMIISKYGFYDVVTQEGISLDASRIAANIITGISFLGAGMIFVKGLSIKGLTTAAGIWVTSAVGMAVGAGMYAVGFVSVAVLLLVQIIFHKFLIGFDKVLANDNVTPCFLQIENTPESVAQMKSFFKENKIHICDSAVKATADNTLLTIHLNVQFDNRINIDEVFERCLELDGVHQAFAVSK